MKLLLASAPHADTFGYSMPPPGLLRLGGAARAAGIDVALDDLSFRLGAGELGLAETGNAEGFASRCADHLEGSGEPDVLGISVMGATLPIALAILAELRGRWPRALFALGGPGVNGTDLRVLERFPAVDVVARGEGEVTLVELCRAAPSGRDALHQVAGLSLRNASGQAVRTPDRPQLRDLGALPEYAYDLLPPLSAYKALRGEEDGLVPLDSGRGCVYDCSFCSIGRTWSRRSRTLPAARLADEISAVPTLPGGRRAYLCHDIFGADRRHALALCDELERRGARVPWEVRARIDHLDDELLQRMARAGCDRVLLGIESGAAAVRERNQKGMSGALDVLARVGACVAAGVTPILSLILGLPGEGDDELEASLDLCARAALLGGVQVSLHLVNPQPGCALGDEFGEIARPVPGIAPDMALGAGESPEERALIAAHPDIFSTWALLPMDAETRAELVFLSSALGELLERYPRAFAAVRAAGPARRALDVAREWRADGRTFETFARATAGDAAELVDALLAWESALVRIAARGPARPEPESRPRRWRAGGEVLRSRFDLIEASAALGRGELPAAGEREHAFAVAVAPSAPGELPRVRTLRLGAGAATLVERLARPGAADDDHLQRTLAQGGSSLEPLIAAGLLVPPSASAAAGPQHAPDPIPTTAPR